MKTYDIAVIGGGAAGLAAAITALRGGTTVLVAEKEARIGKKLLATGNGRCNFTNLYTTKDRYHGTDPGFTVYANEKFSPENNMAFFRSLGVMTKVEDEGKAFPLSLQAAAVLDMLRLEVETRGADLRTGLRITSVKKENGGFLLCSAEETFYAKKVIVAAGGMASPELGGCRFGYDLLGKSGHSCSELAPALVKIKTDNRLTNGLKGIKVEGKISLCRHGEIVGSEEGEILFTEFGVSGPPVLQLSRLLCFEKPEAFTVVIDLLPEFSEEELKNLLKERRTLLTEATLDFFVNGLVQKKVGQMLIKEALGCKLSRSIEGLTDDELFAVARILKGFSLPVWGVLGWKQAQVTAGGILTKDFDEKTMESKLVPGLYAAGEVLDIDGDCGGFNLQWAWASGRLAAESAVKSL